MSIVNRPALIAEDAIEVYNSCTGKMDPVTYQNLSALATRYGIFPQDYNSSEQLCSLLKNKLIYALDYIDSLCSSAPDDSAAMDELVRLGLLAGYQMGVDYSSPQQLCKILRIFIGTIPVQDLPLEITENIISFLPVSDQSRMDQSSRMWNQYLHLLKQKKEEFEKELKEIRDESCGTVGSCYASLMDSITNNDPVKLRKILNLGIIDTARPIPIAHSNLARFRPINTFPIDATGLAASQLQNYILAQHALGRGKPNTLEVLLKYGNLPKSISPATWINLFQMTITYYTLEEFMNIMRLLKRYIYGEEAIRNQSEYDTNILSFVRENIYPSLNPSDRIAYTRFILDEIEPDAPFKTANIQLEYDDEREIYSGDLTEYQLLQKEINDPSLRLKNESTDLLNLYNEQAEKLGLMTM